MRWSVESVLGGLRGLGGGLGQSRPQMNMIHEKITRLGYAVDGYIQATMLILGIDRDDAAVQEIYDERNLAVKRAISHVIRICRKHGVTTSVCGQAPSNYPEIVEFLIREGATSISVNPDKVIETRNLVASLERKIMLEELRSLREKIDAMNQRSREKIFEWSEDTL